MIRAEGRGKKADPVQDRPLEIYNLTKYRRSNQNTCINQRPIVKKGQRVQAGEVIADGPGTDQGELALGRNVLVAFMPWGGYNFEDAILVSERLVKDDRYTSIHIEEFEIQARDTKLGKEEVTRDIPNVSEEALKDLDESGIVRIGRQGQGRATSWSARSRPRARRSSRRRRSSCARSSARRPATCGTPRSRCRPGIEGTVVDVSVFSRRGIDKDERAKSIEDEEIDRLEKDSRTRSSMVEMERDQKLKNLLVGQDPDAATWSTRPTRSALGKKGDKIERAGLDELLLGQAEEGQGQGGRRARRRTSSRIDEAGRRSRSTSSTRSWRSASSRLRRGDDLPPGVIKMVKVYVAVKRKLSVGDKMAGRHGNKGVVSRVLPEEDMPYLPDGTPVEIVLNPLGVPSRMNVGQILETHLGWAAAGARAVGGEPGVRRGDRGRDQGPSCGRPGCPRRARPCSTTAGPASRSTRRSRSATSTCSSWPTSSTTRCTPAPSGRTRWSPSSRWAARRSSAGSGSARWRCGRWRPTAPRTPCRRC